MVNFERKEAEVTTTIQIPVSIKQDCKRRGIKLKRCFLVGYNEVVNGGIEMRKQNNQDMQDLKDGNKKLQTKLSETHLKFYDLEKQLQELKKSGLK